MLNKNDRPAAVFSSGERVKVRIRAVFHEKREEPMVGILVRNRIGMDVYGTNTRIEQIPLGILQPGEELEIDFNFECWLTPQQYTVTVATQYRDGSSHDWLDDVLAFEVVGSRQAAGVADLRARVSWRKSGAVED